MKNRLFLKGLVLGIIVIFVGFSFNLSVFGIIIEEKSISPLSDGNTFYVGGSGPGNYSRIQDAINDSSNGDTIFVYNGTYYENVVVDKSINLIGEDKKITIIDGKRSGDVMVINADYVNISRFTISNDRWSGEGIKLHSNNNIISNNIISGNGDGIYIFESNSNTILDNEILNNGFGIFVENSDRNTITDNIISNNRWTGIYLIYGSNSNHINMNKISSNDFGIELNGANFNIIKSNNISNNRIGIFIIDSYFNLIIRNNILKNDQHVSFIIRFRGKNIWILNYWNGPRILPKLISGNIIRPRILPKLIFDIILRTAVLPFVPWFLYRLPWFNIDWRPALRPYDI